MASEPKKQYCIGSEGFEPSAVAANDTLQAQVDELLKNDDLLGACRTLFKLPDNDDYVYHASASVSLARVQHIVQLGGVNGLHNWYKTTDETPANIDAYVSVFNPKTATLSALKNFKTNAKKDSIRAECATYLTERRYIHPALETKLTIPKVKSSPIFNPYFQFWEWSCRSLEWCGPCAYSERVTTSHHVLPIFMHHFGCVTPSHESLQMLRILADGRDIADMGSGSGYWSYMLRAYGLKSHPIDNMQSAWRVSWVDDTVIGDGVKWLKRHENGKKMVLLIVYPVVGGGIGGGIQGAFTENLVNAYGGDTIAVVGTQNRNGYTGFKDLTMAEYMEREQPLWTRTVQISLPSFGGKDEALFVFQRGERAASLGQNPTDI
ncbi:hypothetical protein CCM_03342 [Cordyceps militaris CM01]|uniref:Uncharacterized protein n=1 Tax=Cordyceps militaris (strain CM01) TaxID=983644 RepID=G3JA50_CORMM|nr:uncharacterized protein CCM_03342 [Cordyceps militaris CM01]EGX95070.1 hypothetical protein CCM_03342 [Cordyceps militaris CM01]